MDSQVSPQPPAEISLGHTRWVGFATIVIREYGRIVRIWGQTLVPSAVTATLYFVIFGSLIGRRVGPMAGFDYRQFIAPGLIMMSIITNSYGNVVSSFFGAKFGKHIEELLVSPLPNWIIVAGYAVGGLLRGMMVGLVVTAVSLFFARLPVAHLFAIIAAALLTSSVFSLAGFINAMFARNFDQMNFIPVFMLTPLTYFGGVFYSVIMLPRVGAEAVATSIRSCTWSTPSATASSAAPTCTWSEPSPHAAAGRGAVRRGRAASQPRSRYSRLTGLLRAAYVAAVAYDL